MTVILAKILSVLFGKQLVDQVVGDNLSSDQFFINKKTGNCQIAQSTEPYKDFGDAL